MAGYAFRLRRRGYGGRVGSNPPTGYYRIGERCHGGNKLRLGDISITFTITGRNAGHIHTAVVVTIAS
jgi:hypothetical protein